MTTDGKPKIIERIDASGAGDVDMSKTAEVSEGQLKGLTGKSLKVPQDWTKKNIDGNKFRVGCKRIFGLYPGYLRDQVHKQRLEKLWNPGQKKSLAQVTNEVEAFEAAKSGETVQGKDKLAKDNLDAGIILLLFLSIFSDFCRFHRFFFASILFVCDDFFILFGDFVHFFTILFI